MISNRPAYLVMDLDGTMYDYRPCHDVAILEAQRAIVQRYSVDSSTVRDLITVARMETKQRLMSTASSHSRLLYFKLTLEKLGLVSHLDFALQLEAIYWGNFLRKMIKAPGLSDLLELCREEAIPVFVMTDLTTQIQIRKLSRLAVLDYISGLVSSEEVGADKPIGDFFGYTKQHLGLPLGTGWVLGDDTFKDGGLAESSGSEFFLVERQNDGSPSLVSLHKRLSKLCRK